MQFSFCLFKISNFSATFSLDDILAEPITVITPYLAALSNKSPAEWISATLPSLLSDLSFGTNSIFVPFIVKDAVHIESE